MSVADLIRKWNVQSTLHLTEVQSKELLQEAGIRVAEVVPVHSAEEAVAISKHIGLPVVLKVVSRDRIDSQPAHRISRELASEAEVQHAFEEFQYKIQNSPTDALVDGVAVQQAILPGVELRVTVEQDTLFGPVLSFSFGHMAAEVLEDVTYRVMPITQKDARLMVREPKAHRLLQGYRALEAPDVSHIEQMLLKLSDLVEHTPEVWVVELEPVYAYRNDLVVADARVELRGKPAMHS